MLKNVKRIINLYLISPTQWQFSIRRRNFSVKPKTVIPRTFIQFVIAVFVTFHGVLILLLEKLITWTSVASGISFKSGQFYFLWSILWLFVRFCGIKTWIVTEIGYSTDILVYSIFYSIGLTLLLALIAFIPTLLLSRSFFLHQEIRAIHEIFLLGDFGRSFVLTLVEGWSLILYSKSYGSIYHVLCSGIYWYVLRRRVGLFLVATYLFNCLSFTSNSKDIY